MSKRNVDLSELMEQARKRKKIEYDILDHGSRIVSGNKEIKEAKAKGTNKSNSASLTDKTKLRDIIGASKALENSEIIQPEEISNPNLFDKKDSFLGSNSINDLKSVAVEDNVNSAITNKGNSEDLVTPLNIKNYSPEQTLSKYSSTNELSLFLSSLIREPIGIREIKVVLAILTETDCGNAALASLSLEHIGEISGVYKNHVSGILKVLVDRGIIQKEKAENGSSNRYAVNLRYYHKKTT